MAIASRRWTIEENIQASKSLAGLDEHEVRTWTSWHGWVTLVLLAAASERRQGPAPDGLIPLTRNEIAALFTGLINMPAHNARHRLRWSAWRRRHQHRA